MSAAEFSRERDRLLAQIFGEKNPPKRKPAKRMRPRPITDQERAWLARGLESLRATQDLDRFVIEPKTQRKLLPGESLDPQPYLRQLDQLRVIKKCNCGQKNCHTVTFEGYQRHHSHLLVHHKIDDGRRMMIMIHEDTHALVELEII